MKDLNVIVGNNIRSLRVHRSISQEYLAGECGLHRTYVGAVERGERNITLETLNKFAEVFQVPPEYLLIEHVE